MNSGTPNRTGVGDSSEKASLSEEAPGPAITLFDSRERASIATRRYNQPIYSFLNESPWPSIQRVREFWEGWFAKYEGPKRLDLASRFRSFDNHPHISAFLELFTFAALKESGFGVHIEPSAGRYALEFLSRTATGPEFYVECTATGQRPEEVGGDAQEGDLLEAIAKVPTGRFVLGVRFQQRGSQTPSGRVLRRELSSWLQSLERSSTAAVSEAEWIWEDRGWKVRFWTMSSLSEGEEAGGVGMVGPDVYEPREHLRLRSAIDRKATKYGDLGLPLLVVADSTKHQTDRDLMTALLGDVKWQVNMKTRDVKETRSQNGALFDKRGPRNMGLSAVMHGTFGAWSFAEDGRPIVLVHHPFAKHPLQYGLFPFCEERRWDEDSGDMITIPPRTTIGEFFGLPKGWPFFDRDPDDAD